MFLCRLDLNKRILVIGFQFLVISFRGRPMNREKSCKNPPKIIKYKKFVKIIIGAFRYRILVAGYEMAGM